MRFLLVIAFTLSGAAVAADLTIPKSQFVEEFKKKLPDVFCAEKTYFRKCFETNTEKCAKAVTIAANGCFATMEAQLPAQFKQPADGQAWGEKIGNCVGAKIETDSAKSKKLSEDCKDPSKWK
jgi:hypothetical protein